jgi:Ca2+/Na+ antiporter
MGFIRLIIFGFILMSIVYVAISIYSRSVRQEKLEKHWAEDHPGEQDTPERDAYIEAGMKKYRHGLRRKLIWLVYIIPTIAVAVILYLTNAN